MDGVLTIGTKLDTKKFDKQIDDVKDRLATIDVELKNKKELKLSDESIKKLELEAEKLNNKLIQLNKQKEKFNSNNLAHLSSSISSIGNAMEGIVNKAIRWGLAIFSIRSAYSAVRGAISELSSSNEQIASDVEYIRWSLATALKPIIEGIIQLAYKLLTYTAYIAKAWFGVNIFANSSAEAFKKANTNVRNTNKSAKELQKTLTGFDEMNVLQENGSTKAGGGGGGIALPSFDLSNFEFEIPEWIKWIADNKETILGFFTELGLVIAGIKIAQFLLGFEGVRNVLGGIGVALQGMSGLQIFGIVAGVPLVLKGIIDLVSGIIGLIVDPSWSNFSVAVSGISEGMSGLGIIMATLNASNPLGWVLMGIGFVTGLIDVIATLCGAYNDEVDQATKVKNAEEALAKQRDELKNATNSYVSAVDKAENSSKKLEEAEKRYKISGEKLYQQVQSGILDYKNMTETQRIVYKAYLNNINAQEDLEKETKNLKNAQKDEALATANLEYQNGKTTNSYDEMKRSMIEAYNSGKVTAQETVFWFASAMKDMDDASRETFAKDIPDGIKEAISTSRYGSAFNNFKNWWNNNLNKLSKDVYIKVHASSSYAKGGVTHFAKGGIVPKLAPGGIINQPGSGVPYNGAIIGERGAEAIVPLTDSQQMALLGETIGRYINIAPTIPVYVGNRLVAKEIRKINAQDDFAFNR